MYYLLTLFIAGLWSFFSQSNIVLAANDCHDDIHYRYRSIKSKDCEWVHQNNRCESHEKKNGNHVGKYYCPDSCGYCKYYDDHYDHHNDDNFDGHYDDHYDHHDDDNYDGHYDEHYDHHEDDYYDDHHDDDNYDGHYDDYYDLHNDYYGDHYHNHYYDHYYDDYDDHFDHHDDLYEHYDHYYDDDQYGGNWCSDNKGYRYHSEHSKDCKWIIEEHMCDWEENGKHIGSYYCPYSCGHCSDWGGDGDSIHHYCTDNEDYRYNGFDGKDCNWVAKEGRCNNEQNGSHIGKYFCPLSCNFCIDWQKKPTQKPTSNHNSCRDNSEYRYYGDEWKDCKWIYVNNRCHTVRDGKHVGTEFCPKSCGHCHDWHQPSPTKKPTSVACHNSLDLNNYCYENKKTDKIVIDITNCDPTSKDWIGIYDAHYGSLGDNRKWWGDSYMWKFVCESNSCEHLIEKSTIHFNSWWVDLKDGEYKAYLFEDDGYHVKASSKKFKVGNCNNRPPTRKPRIPTRKPRIPTRKPNPPTRKPSTPTKKPITPTKKPISYCHSSVEVEKHCYKNNFPKKIKFLLKNCHPQPKDWIGIYNVRHGQLGNTQNWWGNSLNWQFACGSQKCDYRNADGTLYFEDWWSTLKGGQYKVYLFANNSFEVKALSNTFSISHC